MFSLTSPAFANGESIPAKYTCDGERTLNPPLTFHDIPNGTQSLVLIMEDPDVPRALKPDGMFDHWVLFNIAPFVSQIPEGESSGLQGLNGSGGHGYSGPCPPSEHEPSEHRYFFRLYALDRELALPYGVSKQKVFEAMEGHMLAETELMGRYRKLVKKTV
ncbi:kinase inhibitor [Candidatus Kaiserbacteria bacterium RIFCSPHIGHO2_01_FULL_56_24]|uniref:Kinase inhibitor n=1 Tax=Candidatus Kaiserbacteria bacterium RIFCSPHIGHO2_01_FULL_56_24 TaxID=1798487 RepID=A0A1F6DHZ9_9BACT|nr:MAG: kinase inhibitor [Candidatus Kaiserbacteria bacterium RIFCSPHIGHO2_01_FULL_56_24]